LKIAELVEKRSIKIMNSKNPKLHASVLNCASIKARGGYYELFLEEYECNKYKLTSKDLTPLQWQQLDRVCQLSGYSTWKIENYKRETSQSDLLKYTEPIFRTHTAPDGTVFEEVDVSMGDTPVSYWFYAGTLELGPVAFSDWVCIDRGSCSQFPWPTLSEPPDTVSQRCRLVEGEGIWSEMMFYYQVIDRTLVSDIFKVDSIWNPAIPNLENESPVRQFQFRRYFSGYNFKHQYNLKFHFRVRGSSELWYSTHVEIDGEDMNVRVSRTEPGQNVKATFEARYQCELLPFDRIELHEQSFS
jgi:hypothetical protein